ncbi:unannotated protein [freshwater metagenome]|uniref:Unannotated protein n=1 Tax=freshwater metagenome TaxID=449393 RepID=A0A6J6IJP7_9ZZZZ
MQLLYFVEREYPVSVQRLWSAWTDARELENWYSPVYLSVIPGSVISEPVLGGQWALGIDVSANGFNAYFWGRYEEVIEFKKLSHSLSYSQDQLEFQLREPTAESHNIVIEFEKLDESAWVKFSQFGEMDSEQVEASREGMESYLDNLEQYLENHD